MSIFIKYTTTVTPNKENIMTQRFDFISHHQEWIVLHSNAQYIQIHVVVIRYLL